MSGDASARQHPRPGESLRLGIYVDAPFRVVAGAVPELWAHPDTAGFMLFAAEVSGHFASLCVLGREALADDLLARVHTAHPVTHFAFPSYGTLRNLGEVVRTIPATVRAAWRATQDVDVMWCFGPHPTAILCAAMAVLRGRRVVLGVRQDTMAYFRNRLPSRQWAPLLGVAWLLETVFRLGARRLGVTAVGSVVVDRYGGQSERTFPMKVTLVRRDASPTTRPAWPSGPSTGGRSGPVKLVTVGRVAMEKNPDLAVEAAHRLEQERPGRFAWTWVGGGPELQAMREKAEALGIGERFSLPGFVEYGPELDEFYREAHIFVHVGLSEGLPQVLFEAAAHGLPIVATDVGGVREATGGGDASLLVPPGDLQALVDAVLCVSDSPDRQQQLIAAATVYLGETIEDSSARVAQFLLRGKTTVAH